MSNRCHTLLLVAALGFSQQAFAADTANTRGAKEKRDGYRLLFDGKTTTGWRGFRTTTVPEGWTIVEGALHAGTKAGDLVTTETFADFDFLFDFKIEKGGNSGVIYRASEKEDRTYKSGPEYQIIDETVPDLAPEQHTGSNYGLDAPRAQVARAAGQWNTGRIVVKAGHVEHWLNGKKIVEYQLGSASWKDKVKKSKFAAWPAFGTEPSGHLCLQEHGSPVAFRNLKIRDLGKR